MNIDDVIDRFSNLRPMTKEDEEMFECVVGCAKFTRDFLPLGADPDRMKHALNLLNAFEYVFGNVEVKDKSYIDGATELADRLKKWFVENSNYWFSHSVNIEIDNVLKKMIEEE